MVFKKNSGTPIMLAAFVAALVCMANLSYSESPKSPAQQIRDGVETHDIQCRGDRVLVLRTSGEPACVTEQTAEKTGWSIIQNERSPDRAVSYEN